MTGITRNISIVLFWAAGVGCFSLANAQETSTPVHEHYETGIRLYESGLYEQSARYLRMYLEQEPGRAHRENAHYYLTLSEIAEDSLNQDIYVYRFLQLYPTGSNAIRLLEDLAGRNYRNGDYQDALSRFARIYELASETQGKAEYLFWMAESALEMEDTDSSSTLFQKLADRHPNSEWAPKALYARAGLYLDQEEFDKSAQIFEELRDRYPNDPVIRQIGTALGEMYYRQERYDEAIRALREELGYLEDEAMLKAILLIAESYNYLEQFEEASTHYRWYINISEDEMQARPAHYGLGWVYHKQQVYHWAADAFEKAAMGEDELARKALYYEAINRKLGGRYDRALTTFQRFGDKYTEGPWVERAYYEWALTALELGRNNTAIEVLQRLERSDFPLEDPGSVYSLLGEAYFANNEYSRADQAFEIAQQTTGVDDDIRRQARFQRAWLLYENHAYREARQAFESVYRDQPSDSLAAEALFWSADSYFNLGQWGNAARQFERFRDGYPDHRFAGAAVYSLGWSYFNMREFENAAHYFELFDREYEPPPMALFPYDVDARLRLADSHYALGNYERAISSYEEVAGSETGGDYAIFQMANSYFRDNYSFEAVQNFRRLARIFPESRLREQAQYNIGYIYFQIGNYDQAIEEFHGLINRYPGTIWAARAQYQIGDAYYNAGEYEDAIEAYRLVLDEYPDSEYVVDAVNGVQFAQLAAGEEDTSLGILENFLNQHPHTGTADQLRFRQAQNLVEAGDYREAIQSFRHYIRVTTTESEIPEAWYNIGEAYEQLDEYDQAISAYREIVSDYPESDRLEPALLHIGRLEYEQGRNNEAISALENLVERGGNLQVEGLAALGDAYLANGQIGTAEDIYDRALERRSDYDPALVGKGKVALERGQYMDAEQYFRQVAESNTLAQGAEAQYLLGQVEHARRNYEEAIDAYSRVSALYESYADWVAEAMLATAETYREMGQIGRANQTLQDVIDQYPDTEFAERAARQL